MSKPGLAHQKGPGPLQAPGPFPVCRCDAMRAALGTPELSCAGCQQRARETALLADGWVRIDRNEASWFRQLAIDVMTTGYAGFGRCWAPCWAVTLNSLLPSSRWAPQVLLRANVDEMFRDACFTVIALADHQGADAVQRLHAFATAQGMQL